MTASSNAFVIISLADIFATRHRHPTNSWGALTRYAALMRNVDRRPPHDYTELLAQLDRPEVGSVAFFQRRAVAALHMRPLSTWPRLLVSCEKMVLTNEARQWPYAARSRLVHQLYFSVCEQAITQWIELCDELHRTPFFMNVQGGHHSLPQQFVREEPAEPVRWSTLREQLFATL